MKRLILSIIIVLIIASSCSKSKMKETATGRMSDIAICSPLPVYADIEGTLLDVMYMEVFLPVRESVFKTEYVSYEQLPLYKKSKNMLIITNINRKDEYSAILNGFLNEEHIKEVKDNRAMMFQIFDGFAKGQSILIIAGTDEEGIEALISINRKNIIDFFVNSSHRALEEMVYFTGNHMPTQNELKNLLNIEMDVPSDFRKSFYDKTRNAYSIISHYPERVVTIAKMKNMNYSVSDIVNFRNDIGAVHWNGDYVDTSYLPLIIDTIEIAGKNALQIMGTWSNDDMNYGGPFVIYMIDLDSMFLFADGHIYNPGKRKYFKLMETKTIINTLKLGNDIDEKN